MPRFYALFLPLLLCLTAPASALEVTDCIPGQHKLVDQLMQLQEKSGHAIRVSTATLAAPESETPGPNPLYLNITMTPPDEAIAPQCKTVSYDKDTGFASIDFSFKDMTRETDPDRGDVVTIPAMVYQPEQDALKPADLTIGFQGNGVFDVQPK
ncbi:hypothetical protein IV417_17755 [Alphaproteobacteria bacterium KMM 3653]|uniref:Uncharacterized protein n=1 Tax=Harenicola maris TaxID=2841044 RepID=A0AAP2CTZ9_9RHOB|nr:hypothetical protein [Harenicola maris]